MRLAEADPAFKPFHVVCGDSPVNLSSLLYADDIAILSDTPEDLQVNTDVISRALATFGVMRKPAG